MVVSEETSEAHGGLTKREWFAGQALIGLLSVEPSDCTAKEFAKAAVEQADALLAELAKEP